MNSGRYVLWQVLEHIHWQTLKRLSVRYGTETRVRHLGCRQQLICRGFAQLTWREGLRDIVTCLNARPETLYHLGCREPVARATLAEANEQRDWRVWEDLAKGLISQARTLYTGEDLGLDWENTVYALDATTIDLSLTLFPRADFRRTKAGVTIHTQLDLREPIPTCIHVTNARQHDVLWLDELVLEPGAFYVMDRGYVDYQRLGRLAAAGAFFVTRAKDNLRFTRHRSLPTAAATGVRSDQIGKLTLANSRAAFPWPLRRGHYFDLETARHLIFLTNHLEIPAVVVAGIYRLRWQIELFFRWIKGHLRIKYFFGTSPNAVKTQIWIAVTTYLLVAIIHKQLGRPGTLHRTLQLLSAHPFEKMPLHELFTDTEFNAPPTGDPNQLLLLSL